MTSRKGKSNKSLLMTIGLTGAAVCYVAFIFMPGQRAIGKLRDELDERQQAVVDSDLLAYTIKTTETELEAAKEFAKKWQETAPREARLTELYAQITEQAATAGVKITQFDPQSIEKLSALVKVPLSLTVKGNFQQIFNFVHRIESLRETIWLEEFHLESSEEFGGRRDVVERNEETGEGLAITESNMTLTCTVTLTIFADKRDFSD